jgi:hypothetical protein
MALTLPTLMSKHPDKPLRENLIALFTELDKIQYGLVPEM